MLIPKLALRNIMGAGLRTWLNVVVLSLAFVTIVGIQGLYDGFNRQASHALIQTEYGGGQYRNVHYDPYDPLTFEDSHARLPEPLRQTVEKGKAAPILVAQASIYPNGRLMPAILKGIDPEQKVVDLPTAILDSSQADLPVMIGGRMARNTKLQVGDMVTIRWRDVNGVFDARDAEIVRVFKTSVPTVDQNLIWMPLEKLQELMQEPDEATIVVMSKDNNASTPYAGWTFLSQYDLLSDIREIIKAKQSSSMIMYSMLLFLALLAIFDTQVLSIVRRRKEIGMLIAMGMTRSQVIRLFTMEGSMHGILAAVLALIYGGPLLAWTQKVGWKLPAYSDDFGVAISERLYPYYTGGLVIATIVIVMIAITIVSFLPTRRISRLNPTDALRGKRI